MVQYHRVTMTEKLQ